MATNLSPSPPILTGSPSTPPDLADAFGVLLRHAHNPSSFLALNAATSRFSVPDIDGLVAYRRAGRRCVVQFGGVFAAPGDQDALLDRFLAFAAGEHRRVVAVQLLRDDAERYAARGFTVNQFGASYARSLDAFSLKGSTHMQLRNKISKARRSGIVVTEVPGDLPGDSPLGRQLEAIDSEWLRSKGRHVKELAFLVGERGGPVASLRRLFVATDADGGIAAYVSFSPVPGRHSGWLHDVSRRRPDAPPGTMELVVNTAIERFRAEGSSHLHFGLTPFTGIADEHDLPGRSGATARLVRLLASHGSHVYPAADQLAYKRKWGPDLVQPEYVGFAGRVRMGSVWSLLRLTNAL